MEMKMMWHVVFIILTMFLSQELSFAQVTGCDEGYSKRLVEKSNGVVEPICCKDVVCGPETQVKWCTSAKGFDICEDCPNGTTQPQNSSSSDSKPCYEDKPSCGEDAERGPTGECECKAGYCGKYPDCLRSLCPGQETPAPIPMVSTPVNTAISTTTTSTTTTSASMTQTLPSEKPWSPDPNPGTTPTLKTASTSSTSSTEKENGNDQPAPVIIAVVAVVFIIIVIALVALIWCCRKRFRKTRQQPRTEVPYTSVSTDEERGNTSEMANGGYNGTTRPTSPEDLNQRNTPEMANGGYNGTTRPTSPEDPNQNGGPRVLNVTGEMVQITFGGGQNVMNTFGANQLPYLNGGPVANHEPCVNGGPAANHNPDGNGDPEASQHHIIDIPEPNAPPAAEPQPVEEQRCAVQVVEGGDHSDHSSLLVS